MGRTGSACQQVSLGLEEDLTDTLAAIYVADITDQFRQLKGLAERAFVQVDDADLFTVLDEESNSLAALIQHMAGNLRSRWTDFLTTDGEKPDRDRDSEFIATPGTTTRAALLARWEEGWLAPVTIFRTMSFTTLVCATQ